MIFCITLFQRAAFRVKGGSQEQRTLACEQPV